MRGSHAANKNITRNELIAVALSVACTQLRLVEHGQIQQVFVERFLDRPSGVRAGDGGGVCDPLVGDASAEQGGHVDRRDGGVHGGCR